MLDPKYGKITTSKKTHLPPKMPALLLLAQDKLGEKYVRMYAEDYLEHTGDVGGYRNLLLLADQFRLWPTKGLPD